jgi:hypothetical protein
MDRDHWIEDTPHRQGFSAVPPARDPSYLIIQLHQIYHDQGLGCWLIHYNQDDAAFDHPVYLLKRYFCDTCCNLFPCKFYLSFKSTAAGIVSFLYDYYGYKDNL